MQRIPRILVSTFLGGLFCSLLTATLFSVGSIIDGTRPEEALAYGVVVGVVAGFFGVFIGMAVGIGNLGPLGGALVGLVTTVGAVAFYVITFSRPNQYGYFLDQSTIIVLVLGLPTLITGIVTGWLNKTFAHRAETL
ncbi:MAG: hypothetical protein R6X18_00310 [Chloroflexota bacterium]|jgi:hypothetical protein